ncbi:iron transporter [Dehalococcoidia bacterium]|nr:iron transporter [Dehalococcoidia bacterium]
MANSQTKLRSGFFAGVGKGWSSFLWISKIIIPVSFLVTILRWAGWLEYLDVLLEPLMNLINLPPEAGLPVVTGMLLGTYSVIAIITVIPFTIEQMTLIAVFTLISHALIVEGIIQHKSGLNIIKASVIRLTAAIVAVLVVSQFLGDTSQSVVVPVDLAAHTPFTELLYVWGRDTAGLLVKVFGIIMPVMIILESLKSLGWIEYSLKFFRPLMRILGLSDRTAVMCVAAIVFGLMYGGAIIVEEAKKGSLRKEELERLHISIGINHAMIEDPALFAVLGLPALWLWGPRFIMAIIAVQIYRGIRSITASAQK